MASLGGEGVTGAKAGEVEIVDRRDDEDVAASASSSATGSGVFGTPASRAQLSEIPALRPRTTRLTPSDSLASLTIGQLVAKIWTTVHL